MKKLIYILLGATLVAGAQSCTEAVASVPTSLTGYDNYETITSYKVSVYGRVDVTKVDYKGKSYLITTAWSGEGVSINTIEIK